MAKAARTTHDPGRQVYWILKVYFIIALILIGLDKFFYELCNWSTYISPFIMQMVSCQDRPLMGIVGLLEIIIGIGLIFWPRVFSYVVCAWLFLVIINCLMAGRYLDTALRDVGLLLAAFCLALLSAKYAVKHKHK